jgi:hypothetical protein
MFNYSLIALSGLHFLYQINKKNGYKLLEHRGQNLTCFFFIINFSLLNRNSVSIMPKPVSFFFGKFAFRLQLSAK